MNPACLLLLLVPLSVQTAWYYDQEVSIVVVAPLDGHVWADSYFCLMTETEPVRQELCLFSQMKRMDMSSKKLI
jgi:hypothetical protein